MTDNGTAPDAVRARIDTALEQKAAKPRIHMLTQEMILAGLPAVEYGARKYAPWAWLRAAEKGEMSYVSLLDAAVRHILAFTAGEDNDPESGANHLHHAACNLGFLLTFIERGLDQNDDRPASESEMPSKMVYEADENGWWTIRIVEDSPEQARRRKEPKFVTSEADARRVDL